jgi:PRC-barrel domain
MRHDSNTPRIAALRNLQGYKVADGDPDIRGWEVVGGDGRRIGTVNDLLVDTAESRVRYLDIELDAGLYRQGTPAGPLEHTPDPAADAIPELDPMASPGSGVIGHVAVPAAEIDPNQGSSSVAESFIRGSLSDTENRMTAHHHLDNRHHPGERHVVFPVGQAQLDEQQDRVILASQRAEDAVNLPAYVPGEVSPDYEQALRKWFDPGFTPSADRDLYAHDLYDEDRFYSGRRAALRDR